MLIVASLPELLWEPAVSHTTHIRDRSYMTTLADKSPYQKGFGMKLDAAYLRKFGTNVEVHWQD
jgi:hypothetical protein